MKLYKSLFVTVASAILLLQLASCKKQLEDVIPQDAISKAQVLSDPNAAVTLYNGMYSLLRSYNSTLFMLGEMRSDIWTNGLFTESLDPTAQQLNTQNISATNVPYGNWAGFYTLIYNVNNIINLFPQTKLSQADKDQMMAQAYGIRAYIYFTMLRTWGAVPLTTVPIQTINNASETFKARTPADSIMIQVKSDIDKSLQLFGPNNVIPSGKRVYWSRVASLVLKGDVYIWSGTLAGGGSQDLNTALTALQEVESLQSSVLKLDANYADIFDPTKKNNNPEIIFALNYEVSQTTNGVFGNFLVNNIQATTLSLAPAATPLVSSVYPFVGGANRVGMSQAMISRLTSGPADQRISNTFQVMYSNTAPFATRGILLTKYIGVQSGTSQTYTNDYPIYRYAEVLLLTAEAKTKLGLDPTPEIDSIRSRAYGPGYTPFVNGSQVDNMNAILEEGLREFIAEGKRWFALRRAGDQYVFNNIDPSFLSPATISSGHGPTFLLPITTSMMNNDPLLAQTQGY